VKKVLWVSRHNMTDHQIAELRRICSDDISITQYADTLDSIEPLYPLIDECDIIAVVLPIQLLKDLVAYTDKMVIMTVSERKATGRLQRLPDGRLDPEFIVTPSSWIQIVQFELQTRKL